MTVYGPRRAAATQEQACALHLLDLVRVYPRNPAAAPALAMLEAYRIRGAEARKQAELKAAGEPCVLIRRRMRPSPRQDVGSKTHCHFEPAV
jgi:hypothetical protein